MQQVVSKTGGERFRTGGPVRAASERKAPAAYGGASRVLEGLPEGLMLTDPRGAIRFLNRAAEALVGCGSAAARGRTVTELVTFIDDRTGVMLDDPVSGCLRANTTVRLDGHATLVRADGTQVPVQVSASPVPFDGGAEPGAALLLRDDSGGRGLVREMSWLATHDGLTRLLNRLEFHRRLERVLAHMTGSEEHALLYLDLDRFKTVNDTSGHAAGDAVLRQVAAAFSACVRGRDTLARLGGDEFALLLEHCTEERAREIARALRQSLKAHPVRWKSRHFDLGVSIGLNMIRGRLRSAGEVLAAADRACYAAKREGTSAGARPDTPAGAVTSRTRIPQGSGVPAAKPDVRARAGERGTGRNRARGS